MNSPANLIRFSRDKKPVVVWNSTLRCNLRCTHCYSDSMNKDYPGELTTEEAEVFINDLAEFDVPVLIFSGGEPLFRRDIFDLARQASDRGIRTVLSTNGTLLTRSVAARVFEARFSYVGISLDGVGLTNDRFRGKEGAFNAALQGIRNCVSTGIKVGLRFTITRRNVGDILAVFGLVEREKINRLCFYHLVHVGRGADMVDNALTHQETRRVIGLILREAEDFQNRQVETRILTVDNHADGPYLYLKVKEKDPERAEEVLQLLRWNGGNNSGVGLGCVDSYGYVHPDQFWRDCTLGSIRTRPFSEIWTDSSDPFLTALRHRLEFLKGRCSSCRFLDICNGNLRIRAIRAYGDIWAPDPACYLTDDEIYVRG